MIELATGLGFPEGPVWMSDGSIVLVEVQRGTIRRCSGGSSEVVAWCDGGPNGAALGPDGALYVCNNGGLEFTEVSGRGWLLPGVQATSYGGGQIQRVDLGQGVVSSLYRTCRDRPLSAPNDLAFDGAGGFWFTDHGQSRGRTRDWGGVYYAQPDGSQITEVLHPLDGPNGIGISPAGDRLYVTETVPARLWSWEIVEPGVLRLPKPAPVHGGELVAGLGGYHLFDSLAVDQAGNICIGTMGDVNGITVVSPDGSSVSQVALPDPAPTNLCFGGDDPGHAYVTLSASGRLVSIPWPPNPSTGAQNQAQPPTTSHKLCRS